MSDIDIDQKIYEVSQRASGNNYNPNKKSYSECLEEIRSYLSREYAHELSKVLEDENSSLYLKSLVTKYILDKKINVEGIDKVNKLAELIYFDMAGFGFLDKYIYRPDIEEINGNSWDDVEIVTTKGWEKIPEKFENPQQCQDIIKKMMRLGGVTLDEKCPTEDSYITKGIRVSSIIPPCVDDEVGGVFSIRKQNNVVFSKEQLIDCGTANEEEINFLTTCIEHGVSIAIAGATGAGKTATINFLLHNIPIYKRIYTIEDSRELNAIKRDNDGRIINRVIHTKTRPSEKKERDVNASTLLRRALRFDPDIIVPAEMRGEEALIAQEAGRTGHTILASLHANTALSAYTRILTMCMSSGIKLSESLMLKLIIEAFPIMVFMDQLPDKSRKIMKIYEAVDYKHEKIVGKTLYSYVVTGKEMSQDGSRIQKMKGRHKKVEPISNNLAYRLLTAGADIEVIKCFADNNWNPELLEGGEDHY